MGSKQIVQDVENKGGGGGGGGVEMFSRQGFNFFQMWFWLQGSIHYHETLETRLFFSSFKSMFKHIF